MKKILSLMLVLGLALGLTACNKNKKADAAADLQATSASNYDAIVEDEEVVEAIETVDSIESVEVNLAPVYFNLNEYSLSKGARNILKANSEILKTKGVSNITVEGNCDDRGTIAYNIALGQKRANEVRDYYIKLGVKAENINTVSYGEENPVCTDQTESCWAKNRRANTVVSAK